jgi:hypothetical protein
MTDLQAEGKMVEQNAPAPDTTPPQGQRGRGAMVRLPDNTTIPIKDYVTKRFHETGGDRGTIAAELGKTYQYVYNMTKGPEFQGVGQARNRDAVIEVVPGQAKPGHERTARKPGGNGSSGGTLSVGGAGNQQVASVEEVHPDEIERVLGEETGERQATTEEQLPHDTEATLQGSEQAA